MVKKLFYKILLLTAPLWVIGIYFVVADPMKVVYSDTDPVSPGVLMNDRHQQAEYLIEKPKPYNSFIFGSSRSKAFKTWNWKNYLPKSALPYHMGVNDETLFGIEAKLHFLSQQGYEIDHALLLLDHRLLSLSANQNVHIFRESYRVSGETKSSYYQRFVIAFLKPNFQKAYWQYKWNGSITDDNVLWDPGFKFHKETGDIDYARMDSLIHLDSLKFYEEINADYFYTRDSTETSTVISTQGWSLLKSIADKLKKNNTQLRLVITPNYDQIPLHDSDLSGLQELFGTQNVFNYSGKNKFTNDIGNYYEHKHFKPYIANELLKQIYARP